METGPLRSGKDTWVGSGKPGKNHNEANRLRLKSGEALAFLHTKNPVPNRQTTVAATYTMYAAGPASEWAGTKTLTLRRTADRKPFSEMTWDNKPGVTGSAVSVTVTDAQPGDAITFTVTQHIETSKDGPWYGWRLETDSTTFHKVYGYESDYPPTLEVTYAISPTQPVDLSPSGGAVSKQFPTFTFDAVDLENPNDMTALEIEIATGSATDADGSFTTPEFSTGEVASSAPMWDSTGSAWAGMAGPRRYWIGRYKSGDGKWGPWSDPAWIEYTPKGTVTITNPAVEPNNFVEEATPPFIHTFSGTQVAWRKFISLADDRTEVVANSGKQDGTDTSWTPPKKRLQEGVSYVIHTWVWDDVDRVASPGDPVMAKAEREFTFQHDATIDKPVMVGAAQDGGTPFVIVTVTRASGAPDSWTLIMDGKVVDADIDPADTIQADLSHDIPFAGATPFDAHTFEVRAVVNGKASAKSDPAVLTTKPKGVWLLDYDRERYVHLFENDIDNWRRTDQMGVYETVGGKSVQVYAGSNGIRGSFTGAIGAVEGRTRKAWLRDFEWMAERPMRTYQLVTADLSIPVKIRNASATPHPETIENHMMNRAYFEFSEHDEDES